MLARQMAVALPDRVAATHRAVALLAGCVAALERQNSPAAEADPYEALAVELVATAGPADWSALRSDPDCTALVKRAGFAKAIGK